MTRARSLYLSVVHTGNQNNWNLQRGNLYQKFCLRSMSVLCTVSTVFIGFVEPEICQLWRKVFDTFRRVNWSFDSKHLVFTFSVPVSIAKVAIAFCYCSVFEKLIVSSKSLIEVLEKFFECLETQTSILESQNSKLTPRNSILDSQNLRGSTIEFRVEIVNLHLPGTVLAEWIKRFREKTTFKTANLNK